MSNVLVLVDGEHYPPVVERTLSSLRAEGHTIVAAVFLGGTEKTSTPPQLTIPLAVGDPAPTLAQSIDEHQPDLVIDLSDEPILDHRKRFELISVALVRGVAYSGAGYRFDPPKFPPLTTRPTVAVTGTGKRTGKTAVAIELARHWRDAGQKVCIVTMGRGGPETPMTLRADQFDGSVATLARLAELGLHAASDYVEDAVFAGVDTIGTYRCGAGVSGETDRHNFAAGVAAANELPSELLIFEGSGTAIPPAQADAQVLVMPVFIDPEFVGGYLGPYRVRTASAVVVIDPAHDQDDEYQRLESLLNSMQPDLKVFRGGYRLEPSVSVEGKRVVVVTTAPQTAAGHLTSDLLQHGAISAEVIHSLSNRTVLASELDQTGAADVVIVEVKAAAVDLVVPWASARQLEVGLIHNQVVFPGGTGELADVIEESWPGQVMTS